jgi:hypothetical protein
MPAYEVVTVCNVPQYENFIIDADGLEDADYKAVELMKGKYPEGSHFDVEEIKPIKED